MSWCESCRTLEKRAKELETGLRRVLACADEAERQLEAMTAERDELRAKLLDHQRKTAQQRFIC